MMAYQGLKTLGRAVSAALVLGLALGLAPSARAESVQEKLDALGKLTGAERQTFLEAKAIEDGKIVVYAADDPNVMQAWSKAFHEKYPGIEVEYVRMNTRDMMQRVVAESKAGRPVASLLGGVTATELEYLKSEGLLASYFSPEAADFDPAYKDAGGLYTAHWVMPEVNAYNTGVITADKVPTTIEELITSPLGSRIGRLQSGGRWLAGIAAVSGKDAAIDAAKKLALLKPQLFKSNSDLTNALTSGQIAVASDMHAGNVEIAKSRGAPVDYVVPEPLFLLPAYTVFLKDAPQPYAAALNYDWRLARDGGQALYAEFHQSGPRNDTDYAFASVVAKAKTVVPLTSEVLAAIGDYDKIFRSEVIGQ